MAIEFNGVTLPDIPAEILASYPYVVVFTTDGTTACCLCCAGPLYSMMMEGDIIAFATGLPGMDVPGFGAPGWNACIYAGETWYPLGGSETEPFLTNYGNPQFTAEMLQTMFYANHDVLIATTDDGENITFTDDVYFANSDVSFADEYVVKGETLVGLGDSVRNATGTNSRYSLEAMKTELDKLSKGAITNCNTVSNMNTDESYLGYYSNSATFSIDNITSIASCLHGVIKKLELPNVETIPSEIFSTDNVGMNIRLKEVVLDSATTIGGNAFLGQTLTRIIAPKLTTLGTAFTDCAELTEITRDFFPELINTTYESLVGCSKLARADFIKLAEIGTSSFRACDSLKALVLRKTDAICEKVGANTWDRCPLVNGKGVVIVPSNLVSTYLGSSSSWSEVYSSGSQFLALEEYTVDGTLTGDIDWDKVDAVLATL